MHEEHPGTAMKVVFDIYGAGEDIPVLGHLKNRKLMKYLNRETMAAVVALGRLHDITALDPAIPCYYATGMLEYEDYGLDDIMAASRDQNDRFSPRLFIDKGIAAVSPLNQFKVLQNMPLSFASINFGLTGDNAVIYSAAGSLLHQALCAPGDGPVLIGAGKAFRDSSAACGFALVERKELEVSAWLDSDDEAVEMFRQWVRELES
jgi:hypothetical protein